jgi:hypothetical protein
MYQLTNDPDLVLRHNDDGTVTTIPKGHRFWDGYQAWLGAGNTPALLPKATAAEMWERIKAERERRKAGGYKVGTQWYHSDADSRIQQLGLLMMGANIPVGLRWKTLDGTFVDMTPTLAQQVFAAAASSDQAIFAVAETHRVAMEASADPAAYDFSTGWPAVFTG